MSGAHHDWGIIGHDAAVAHLQRMIGHDRVRHAYLFVGVENVGKETVARAFAAAILAPNDAASRGRVLRGSHPDLLIFEPEVEGGQFKIDAMRSAIGRLALKPFEANGRVGIFRDFDNARPQVQDVILKTLEEPAPGAVLILLARSLESVLPTIKSRSQIVMLRPAPAIAIAEALTARGIDRDRAAVSAGISGGRVGWALSLLEDSALLRQRDAALDQLEQIIDRRDLVTRFALAEDFAKDRAALLTLLTLWLSYWRDALLLAAGCDEAVLTHRDRLATLRRLVGRLTLTELRTAVRSTEATFATISTTNASIRLLLEIMFLDYPGLT